MSIPKGIWNRTVSSSVDRWTVTSGGCLLASGEGTVGAHPTHSPRKIRMDFIEERSLIVPYMCYKQIQDLGVSFHGWPRLC